MPLHESFDSQNIKRGNAKEPALVFQSRFLPRISAVADNGIGIAVSGGVDSMALAQLCSGLTLHPPAKRQWDFHFKAYIIDHNAREGSAFEAQRVRDRLFLMGIVLSSSALDYH